MEEVERFWFQCPACGDATSRPSKGIVPLCERFDKHANFVLMMPVPVERVDFTSAQIKDLLERTDALFEASEARIALLLEQRYGCTFGEGMRVYLERRRCYNYGEHPERPWTDSGILCPIEMAIEMAITDLIS